MSATGNGGAGLPDHQKTGPMTDTALTKEKKAGHGATTTVELEARPAKWEIAPGHTVEGFTFNGSVPGPTIEARVGEEIVIRLKSSLPEPTVVHWHGLRIAAGVG